MTNLKPLRLRNQCTCSNTIKLMSKKLLKLNFLMLKICSEFYYIL